MREHGHVWTATCLHCGKSSDPWGKLGGVRWQEEKPSDEAPHTADCCDAVCFNGAPPVAAWEHDFIHEPRPLRVRVSGFSTSESDFTPHFNRAFHRPVRSLAQMKALQKRHGTEDAVVKGDGAERHAPRDIGTRIRHHAGAEERLERTGAGRWQEPGSD